MYKIKFRNGIFYNSDKDELNVTQINITFPLFVILPMILVLFSGVWVYILTPIMVILYIFILPFILIANSKKCNLLINSDSIVIYRILPWNRKVLNIKDCAFKFLGTEYGYERIRIKEISTGFDFIYHIHNKYNNCMDNLISILSRHCNNMEYTLKK